MRNLGEQVEPAQIMLRGTRPDEVRRRLGRLGSRKAQYDDFTDRTDGDGARGKAHAKPKPSAKTKPSSCSKPASVRRRARQPKLPVRSWLGSLAAAGLVAVGASLLFRYVPGLLVVVSLLVLGAGVLWSDRRGL